MSVARLQRSDDVRRALRRGDRRGGRLLVVHVYDRVDARPARLTAVASRRVGGAVQRNRAKRLLREAARLRSWPAGSDVVLVARAAAASADLDAVRTDLDRVTEQMFAPRAGATAGAASS